MLDNNSITATLATPAHAAPAEAQARRITRTRWHYTTGQKFTLIAQDGIIKPATIGVPRGERPIVWFSTHPMWEPTACKGMINETGKLVRLTMDQTREMGGGLVRFAVALQTAPHDWRALKELSGMSGRMAQHLYHEGIRQGARPGDWWGTFDPVPRSKWLAIQVYDSGEWVDVRLEE